MMGNWRMGKPRGADCPYELSHKGLSYFFIMDIGSVRALVAFSWKVLAEGHLPIRRA